MMPTILQSDRPEDCLRATLYHLELTSPDPARLAAFYEDCLAYEVAAHGTGFIASGPDRHLQFEPGPVKGLGRAGYAVLDITELDRLRQRAERRAIAVRDAHSPFLDHALEVIDPDGTRFIFGVPLAPTRPAPAGRVARLQHVVIASEHPGRIVTFAADLGFTVSDNVLDDVGGVRTSFLRCSPEHHSFAVFKAPRSRLDHHCYEVPDWNGIRDWADHFAAARIPLVWGPGRHGPGNNLFFFVHDPDENWVEFSAELEIVEHHRPTGEWPHEERTLNSWGAGLLRS